MKTKTSKKDNFEGKYTHLKPECKQLYIYQHWQRKDLLNKYTELSADALDMWIKREGWASERDALVLSETQEIATRRKAMMTKLLSDGLEVISSTVSKYKQMGMTMEEVKDLSTSLANIDKLLRLTDGAPTEITENRNLNVQLPAKAMATKADIEDAIKIIQDDPFTKEEE